MTAVPLSTIQVAELRITHAIAQPPREALPTPVLMLHGWGADSSLMWTAAERLAGLGHRVYVPDLPGFGASQPPNTAWSVFDYANFLLAYLDAQSLSRVHLIGHSFGGRLALILGADHAHRVEKIALANSAGVPPKRAPGVSIRTSAYTLLRDGLYQLGAKPLADRLRAWYGARYGSADFQAASGVMRETFVKVVNENLLPYAARVQRPTLLFWGDQDQDTPLWMGRTLEQTLPDAGLIVWEGAGHYSYLERVADFVRIVDHYFRDQA
jgi:pimeloyl-ACP methyl ester carboxylesterase